MIKLKSLVLTRFYFILLVFGEFGLFNSFDINPATAQSSNASVPLIPIRDLFADRHYVGDFTLSEKGTWLTWRGVEGIQSVIKFRRLSGGGTFTIKQKNRSYFLDDDLEKLFLLSEKEMGIIDLRYPNRKPYTFKPKEKNWNFAGWPSAKDPHWHIENNDVSEAAPDLVRYDIAGKNRQIVAKNDGRTFGWSFTEEGAMSTRRRSLENGARTLEVPTTTGWWKVLTIGKYDRFSVQNAPRPGQTIWALSDRGRDKLAVVKIDPRTGQETLFYSHPDVDVEGISFDHQTQQPLFATISLPYPKTIPFDERIQRLLNLFQPKDRDFFSIQSMDQNLNRFIVSFSRGKIVPKTYAVDLPTNQVSHLSSPYLSRHEAALSETWPLTFNARDGMRIPAFITLPRGANNRQLPMLVFVHGGPAGHDTWYTNSATQFLANRGYAVLRVNFRGSTGYGRAFQHAGFGEMGRKIQQDVYDATDWAINQGIADPNRIAIIGPSHGGYSALMGAWQSGGRYKAAVSFAGVSDMERQTMEVPKFWELASHAWYRYSGDPKDPRVRQNLKAISPINHAEKFNVPVLLIHGTKDRIVVPEDSYHMEKALRLASKQVTSLYLKGEEHGAVKWQSRIKMWRKIEKFLAKHIGGRNGGFDYTEIGAAFLR